MKTLPRFGSHKFAPMSNATDGAARLCALSKPVGGTRARMRFGFILAVLVLFGLVATRAYPQQRPVLQTPVAEPASPRAASECLAARKQNQSALRDLEKRSDQLLMRIIGASVKEWKEHNQFTAEKAERQSIDQQITSTRRSTNQAYRRCMDRVSAADSAKRGSATNPPSPSQSQSTALGPRTPISQGSAPNSYDAWMVRDRRRNEREAAILRRQEKIVAEVNDEDVRRTESERAAGELEEIHRERMRDKKPPPSASRDSAYSEDTKEIFDEVVKKGVDTSFKAVDEALARDQSQAAKVLKGPDLARYQTEMGGFRGFIGKFGQVAKRYAYAVDLDSILRGETDEERGKTTSLLLKDIVRDDVVPAVTDRMSLLAARLLGPRAAAWVLATSAGPVGFAAKVGSDVVQSTDLGQDAIWVIRDTSGQTTLEQKKRAMDALWRQYEKYPERWNPSSERVLMELSSAVYWRSVAQEKR